MRLRTLIRLFFFFLLCSPAVSRVFAESDTYDFSLRYHQFLSQSDALDQTFLYHRILFPWLELELGSRLQENGLSLDMFSYKADLKATYFNFFQTTLRLNENNYFNDASGVTNLMAMESLVGRPFSFIELFGGFGGYFRFTNLSGATFFPAFSNGGMDSFGLVADLGLNFFFSDAFRFFTRLSTYEELTVYNIHNPFAQATIEYEPYPNGVTFSAFFRYRILLGFGRMDEVVTGVGLRLPAPVFDSVSVPF